MAGIYKLFGTVKHYDWGGVSFIPTMLKKVNEKKMPYAEYWMGIHPSGQSVLDTGGSTPTELSQIANGLPYLFKVLDVKDMLSIQVHPSKAAAETAFEKENTAGIPMDDRTRNYKDGNHKPELMVALSDFWLLHGFKPTETLVKILTDVAELNVLLPVFNNSGYVGLYKHIMEMPQAEVNRILQPLMNRIADLYKEESPDKLNENYWASKAAISFIKDGNIDRGIFSVYLFNLVYLKKGEGIFQAEGVPHAYLEGQNVEIMANSDNVLRGGLTAKHIDVNELMKHIKCEPVFPEILSGEENGEGEKLYQTPITDFVLSVFEMQKGDTVSFQPSTTEILLLTEGIAEVDDDESVIKMQTGTPSVVVFPGGTVYIAAAAKSVIFRASAGPIG